MPTKMTATNTLNKGLVMDFNPLITKDDCLTNALNATLLTFNGNEMQLQQDMGNGRVETAFLPEGYVPVGTCEFGDIIYVVSYNPLENKSQIGCFPSPERNISSDEITDMQQSLAAADFQEFSGGSPTGVLKATSVKKILYGDKNMNPGDKYIIYEEATGAGNLENNASTLSDFGNTAHTLGTWPKLLKIKVVSIEESGKIVDLGASVKWYDNNYYLTVLSSNSTGEGKDIDSYRSLVSSAYSVFQSKVSGKLALLAELEAVESFSCTHDVFTEETANGVKHYIYFYTSWRTSHPDVNPSGFIITKSAWIETAEGGKLRIPQLSTEGGETVVRYKTSSDALDVPIKDGWDKDNNQWAVTQVKEYTRLYDLANPSSDYETYLTKNFDFLYKTQVTWNLGLGETGVSKDDLRPITRATRLLTEEGRPNEKREYVFNLDSYERDDSETIYKTKDRQGILRTLAKVQLSDDVINNYFGKDIPTLVSSSFIIEKYNPELEDLKEAYPTDLSNLIWNYSVAPVMPYGVLDWLTVNGTIDFSKLGSGEIDLTAWRYYVSGGVATLTWGLEAYPEPNKGIAEVHFDFYDNQGFAAGYKITGKSSYSGVFTDNIVLGQKNSSHRLVSVDAYNKTFPHAGNKVDEEDPTGEIVVTTRTNKPEWGTIPDPRSQEGPWTSDTGTLSPNMLYLVRITVKYTTKDLMDNYDLDNETGFRTFWRWMWTNGVFNEKYYSVADFENLSPQLGIDFSATFDTRGNKGTNPLSASIYEQAGELSDYNALQDGLYKTLGTRVYSINQSGKDDTVGNVLLSLTPGLQEGFNTYNLLESKLNEIKQITIKLGKSKIQKTIEQPAYVHTGSNLQLPTDVSLQPQIAPELDGHDSTGWDWSGYIYRGYGKNNVQLSDSFINSITELDGAAKTYTSYTASQEDPRNLKTGSSTQELNSSDTAYLSYLDSFSLNLIKNQYVAGEKEENSNEWKTKLAYLDIDGQEQQLSHYSYRTVDLKTAREGIPLVLSGIAFSKLYASELKQDTTGKIVQSIMNNTTEEYGSPKKFGFNYQSGHLYFRKVLFWGMGEERATRSFYGRAHYTVSATGWTGTKGEAKKDNPKDNWTAYITSSEIQALKSAFSDTQVAAWTVGPVAHGSGNTGGNDEGECDKIYIYGRSFSKLHSTFGDKQTTSGLYASGEDAPSYWRMDTGKYKVNTLAVWDRTANKWYPLTDYFISKPDSQDSYDGGLHPCLTLADMLGSLFSQLYAVTTEETAKALLSNFVTLQPYNENWIKDIIIEANVSDLQTSANVDTVRKLISIHRMPTDEYLQHTIANMYENTKDEKMNDIVPTEAQFLQGNNTKYVLYGTQRVISFQFGVNYDIGNLVYTYEQASIPQNQIKLATLDKADDTPKIIPFQGAVQSNTLYTWTGTNVIPFGSNSTIYYASKFADIGGKLYSVIENKKQMKSSIFSGLAKVLKYEDQEIFWDNLSQLSGWNTTYNMIWDGHHANHEPELHGLPLVSIFNENKPG